MASAKEHFREASAWVEDYIRRNPKASTYEVARAANNNRMTLDLSAVADIKRRIAIEPKVIPAAERPAPQVVPTPRPPRAQFPFNPPKLVVTPEPPPEPEPPTAPPVAEAEDAISAPGTTFSTVEQRKAYVNELVEADPTLEGQEVLDKVKERFGIGIGKNYVYETLRVAREVAGLPVRVPYSKAPVPQVTKAPVAPAIASTPAPVAPAPAPTAPVLEETGFRVVAWPKDIQNPAAGLQFQVISKEQLGVVVLKLLANGLKQESIRVFREVPFKINYNIEVG